MDLASITQQILDAHPASRRAGVPPILVQHQQRRGGLVVQVFGARQQDGGRGRRMQVPQRRSGVRGMLRPVRRGRERRDGGRVRGRGTGREGFQRGRGVRGWRVLEGVHRRVGGGESGGGGGRLGVAHLEVLVGPAALLLLVAHARAGGVQRRRGPAMGRGGHGPGAFRVLRGLQVGDAPFEVAEIVDARLTDPHERPRRNRGGWGRRGDTYLQNGQLVHLLPLAGGHQGLQDAKLLVHLRPPPSFDDRVRRLPGHLLAGRARRARLLLRGDSRGGRGRISPAPRGTFGDGLRRRRSRRVVWLLQSGLHLDDLPGPGRRGRQRKVGGGPARRRLMHRPRVVLALRGGDGRRRESKRHAQCRQLGSTFPDEIRRRGWRGRCVNGGHVEGVMGGGAVGVSVWGPRS